MPQRPRIGITLDVGAPDENRKTLELPADYARAIFQADGLPLLLPFTHDASARLEMIDSIDGLLVPGGSDLNPALYGESIHPQTKLVDPDRQAFDLAMLSLAEARRVPTLGICLGSQTMNVHRRGTLHQHLTDSQPDSPLLHTKKGDRTNLHDIIIRPGTKLAEILKLEILPANSRHHQGYAKLGHGLVASAAARDGLVEAFEDPTLPFWLGVQWHPENLPNTEHAHLFAALVAAAREYRKT